jgi:hypothetical protein
MIQAAQGKLAGALESAQNKNEDVEWSHEFTPSKCSKTGTEGTREQGNEKAKAQRRGGDGR